MSASVSHIKRKPQVWHRDLQVYVAAFQYLHKQQLVDDADANNGTTKSDQLQNLMSHARGLLCEMENTINSTDGKLRKPRGRIQMAQKLNFIDDSYSHKVLDLEFTIERFYQYVADLDALLERRVLRLSKLQDHLDNSLKLSGLSKERKQNKSSPRKRTKQQSIERRRKRINKHELFDNNLYQGAVTQNNSSYKSRHNDINKKQQRRKKKITTTIAP